MDRLRALINAAQNPFSEEYDTLSRARELWDRRGELGEQLGEVGREASKDVTRALDTSANREIRVRQAQQQEDAKSMVGGARDAAGRAADVAARVFNQAAEAARPLVPKPPRPSRQAQEEAAAKRGPTKVGPFNRDELIESRPEWRAPMTWAPLPGEEQVTSMQTLGGLPPEVRAGLEAKYKSGGHADTMSFEDWVSEHFAELPPDQRADAMRESATSTPRIRPGRNPNLRPGEMSDTAAAQKAAGKPLPEGREPEQYSPEQRRTMSRNIYAPEVPMQPFGGSSTVNVDGSTSMRAPDPAKLKALQDIEADPEQGKDSVSWLMAAADLYGIDAARYGDDMDLLRGHVMREHARHTKQMQVSDIVPNDMGGFRYAPNAASRQAADVRGTKKFATDMIVRYGDLLSDEQKQQLLALGSAGNMEALREVQYRMGATLKDQRTQAARDRAANFNMTRDMNNGAVAPGMRARALMQQIAENNPDGAAGISQIFGDDPAVPMWLNRANAQAAAEAQRAAVLLDEEEKKKTERQEALGVVGINQQRIEAIAKERNPVQREVMARSFARDNMTVEGSPPPTEEAVNREAAVVLATLDLPANPSPDDVRTLFERFKADKAAFYSLGERLRSRGVTQEMVDKMWAQMSGTSARDRGRAAKQGVQDTISGIGGFVSGLFGY